MVIQIEALRAMLHNLVVSFNHLQKFGIYGWKLEL